VWTQEDRAVAAGHSVDPSRWLAGLDDLLGGVAARMSRVEPRRRVRRFVLGMMAGLPRTNCWSLAEHAGEGCPRGMQRLLSSASWDAEAVLGDVRAWVVAHLGEPDAILVIDETGDVKKGTKTVGVQRQYTGTAGRIENSQVAVYLTYASSKGHALVDRALYLPRSWTEDGERLSAAGVPEDVEFATKPALAEGLVSAAIAASVPARWVAGDEVYGADSKLRKHLRHNGLGYVLAVAKSHQITTGIGSRRAIDLAVRLPKRSWQRLSAGRGSKGERWYDWALVATTDPASDPASEPASEPAADPVAAGIGHHGLLIRRNRATGEYAFYRSYSPTPVSLAALVNVAGRRWTIEESFAAGKELAALDEHQVRTWRSWQRWTALAILAHAFLSVMAATEPPPTCAQTLIRLTRNEIRRLLAAAVAPVHDITHVIGWSTWRRQHQARARNSHHARQATHDQ
jgi:SRSO17 transposase